jgi:hypothetical protein
MDTTADLLLETARSLRALQALLHGEVVAAETYEVAIARLGNEVRPELRTGLASHQLRVQILTVRIHEIGGKPDDSSGIWGALMRLIESGVAWFGLPAVLGSLEEGEDHMLAEYRSQVDELDPESRRLVQAELMPGQQRTHALISALCRASPVSELPPTAKITPDDLEGNVRA